MVTSHCNQEKAESKSIKALEIDNMTNGSTSDANILKYYIHYYEKIRQKSAGLCEKTSGINI